MLRCAQVEVECYKSINRQLGQHSAQKQNVKYLETK